MRSTFLLLMSLTAGSAFGKVVLPGTFSDNMILQQQRTMHIDGTARPSATVTITMGWQKQPVTAVAATDGKWSADITTPKGSQKAYSLTFDDGEKTRFKNVLIGEVWFCSGQSNMEMPVEGWGHVMNWEQEKANAHHPNIRLFQVEHTTALAPTLTVPQGYTHGWVDCSPETVGEFSSLAYFYARELTQRLKVPVGVINSSWGGTPAEAWTSHESLKTVQGFVERCNNIEATGFKADAIQKLYEGEQRAHMKKIEDLDAGLNGNFDKPLFAQADYDDSQWPSMKLPCYWENQYLNGFDGVVWFRKNIHVSTGQAGKAMSLDFGPIDDEDITYWDGEKVAQGWGYNQPRHYVIPAEKMTEGDHILCVRVTDTGGEGGIAGDVQQMTFAGDWKYKVGMDARLLPTAPTNPTSSWWPSTLYNAMVNPFLHYPIRGVIWYQGCANEDRPEQYEPLFQTLIHDWQRAFNQPELPFHFVQIANYLPHKDLQPESRWARLRESQRMATKIDGVEMVVNIDLGDAQDIHPKNKQEVGRRLAALSLATTYGQKMAAEAPGYSHMTIRANGNRHEVVCHFSMSKMAEPFLQSDDLPGFALQAADGSWHVAKAHTAGQTVVVSAADVPMPYAVSYGWADNPTCTLRTAGGFHVSPFISKQTRN